MLRLDSIAARRSQKLVGIGSLTVNSCMCKRAPVAADVAAMRPGGLCLVSVRGFDRKRRPQRFEGFCGGFVALMDKYMVCDPMERASVRHRC